MEGIGWALTVALGFPILLLFFCELVNWSESRHSPFTSTLRLVRNLVLPALAIVAMVRLVLERKGGTWDRITQTALWIILLWVSLTLINAVVFGAAAVGTNRAKVPELLRDVARSILVGLGAALIYSQVWGKEITGAVTALGIGSLVIGLALQEPLGNVFAGLMLLIERPVSLGEWIRVEGDAGKVISMNWRAVNIETQLREAIVVPNSTLYKNAFANLSRPTPVRTHPLDLRFSLDDPPNRVKDVLRDVVSRTPGVLAEPAPAVRTQEFGDFFVLYQVLFSVASQESLYETREEILTRVWYAARRNGLSIPYPATVQYEADLATLDARRKPDARAQLAAHPKFRFREDSPQNVRLACFAKGESLEERDAEQGLCLIVEGHAALLRTDDCDAEQQIGQLGPGEFYGEHSVLAGEMSTLTLRALTDVTVVLFDLETSRGLIERSPQLAREVGETIEQRRRATQSARQAPTPAGRVRASNGRGL